MSEHGITEGELRITGPSLAAIGERWTREAGVSRVLFVDHVDRDVLLVDHVDRGRAHQSPIDARSGRCHRLVLEAAIAASSCIDGACLQVRGFERHVAAVCRAAVVKMVESGITPDQTHNEVVHTGDEASPGEDKASAETAPPVRAPRIAQFVVEVDMLDDILGPPLLDLEDDSADTRIVRVSHGTPHLALDCSCVTAAGGV